MALDQLHPSTASFRSPSSSFPTKWVSSFLKARGPALFPHASMMGPSTGIFHQQKDAYCGAYGKAVGMAHKGGLTLNRSQCRAFMAALSFVACFALYSILDFSDGTSFSRAKRHLLS